MAPSFYPSFRASYFGIVPCHMLWCDVVEYGLLQRESAVKSDLRISVAVPIYNEEKVIPELLLRIRTVLDKLPGGPHEIVLVDDGSSDDTFGLLMAAAAEDS